MQKQVEQIEQVEQRRIFELTATDGGIQMFCYLLYFKDGRRYGTNCKYQISTAVAPVTFSERVITKQVGKTVSIYRKQRTYIEYIDDALDTLEENVRHIMSLNHLNLSQKRADIDLFVRHCKEQISEYEKA